MNKIAEVNEIVCLLNTSLECYAMPFWLVMEDGCMIYL